MGKKQIFVSRLAAVITVLLFMNLFAFVLLADAVARVYDDTPVAAAELPVGRISPREDALREPEAYRDNQLPRHIPTGDEPDMDVKGMDKFWRRRTRINVFHAWYDKETGTVTVKSDNGEKVVAPGTGSRYYFDICNTGSTSGRYWLDCASGSAMIEYNGELVEIPLEIKFYRQQRSARYLVGGADSWEPLTELDGVRDRGSLSSGHYARYVLDWQWPFEGDDVLDTLLGDMAAEGEELRVWVEFNVYMEADDVDGGIPLTGDNSRIALWMGVLVSSGVLLIILLASRKKEKDEESK